MTVFQVSREFSPIAGAGGLGEVVSGLAKSYSSLGIDSKVFIPCYGFIDQTGFKEVDTFFIDSKSGKIPVSVYLCYYNKVGVYYISFPNVENKQNVYTYTEDDEKRNHILKKGQGFLDSDDINIIFQLAFLEFVTRTLESPDVISLHDGHTGLIPSLIKKRKQYSTFFCSTKVFFTIHNAGRAYHQIFSVKKLKKYKVLGYCSTRKARFGKTINPLFLASANSTAITVSSYYAEEILSLEHEVINGGYGNFCKKNNVVLKGITNGIRLDRFEPIGINKLPSFSVKRSVTSEVGLMIKKLKLNIHGNLLFNNEKPIYLFQNRITEQKGIDRLISAFKEYIRKGGKGLFVLMGEGEEYFESKLIKLSSEYSDSFVYVQGYNDKLAMKLFLLSDFFLLPSLWEPCGLTDYEAQLVGSIPLVSLTGGLKKVKNGETGFSFRNNDEFVEVMKLCDNLFSNNYDQLEVIRENAYTNVIMNCSWDSVAKSSYLPLFESS